MHLRIVAPQRGILAPLLGLDVQARQVQELIRQAVVSLIHHPIGSVRVHRIAFKHFMIAPLKN